MNKNKSLHKIGLLARLCGIFTTNQCGRAQPAVGSANIVVLSCVRKQIEKATSNIPP